MERRTGLREKLCLLPTILFFVSWEALGRLISTPLLPPFSRIAEESWYLLANGILLENVGASLIRVIAGFFLGAAAGLMVGILMGWSRVVNRSLSPLVGMLFPIPTLGWLPLLMLWLGLNEALPITLISICSFFPILYNTVTGIKGVDEQYIRTARTLGAGPIMILSRIVIPMALSNIFTGLRLEAGMAWRTVIAAEMFAIPTGIGALLINAESLIRVDIIIVCLAILAFMSLAFERVFLWLEIKATGSWR